MTNGENQNLLKSALLTGIGISVIASITGLSLGWKRSGNDNLC